MSFQLTPRGVFSDTRRQEKYANLEVTVFGREESLYCELRVFSRCVEIHSTCRAPHFDSRTEEVDSLAVAIEVLESWYGSLPAEPLVRFV